MPNAPTAPRSYRSDRPLRVGVLSNPASRGNRRNLGPIRTLLADYPQVTHCEATDRDSVIAGVLAFLNDGVELIVVNAGDGTAGIVFEAVLDPNAGAPLAAGQRRPTRHIRPRDGDDSRDGPGDVPPQASVAEEPIRPPAANKPTMANPPLLCLIKGGNTSMDAGDVGQPGSQLKGLRRVLSWAAAPERPARVHQRDILSVTLGDDIAPAYGMFFGAGAIIDGIRYCDDAVHSRGIGAGIGPGLCTLRVILAMLRGDPSMVSPVPMRVDSDPPLPAQSDQPVDMLVVLVSTLERLFLGLHPYWGEGDGPLHLTSVRFNPHRPLTTLPPLLWGRTGRHATAQGGYRSGRAHQLSLHLDGLVTLDGELYQASPDTGPVRVTSAGRVSFLVI